MRTAMPSWRRRLSSGTSGRGRPATVACVLCLLRYFPLRRHHEGKMSTSGPRGHNSLLGAIDTAMAVEMTSTAIRIKSIKQRDLPIQEQEFRVKLVLADQSGGETCAVEFVGATLEDAQHYGDEGRRLSCDPEVLAFFTKHLSAGPQKTKDLRRHPIAGWRRILLTVAPYAPGDQPTTQHRR